MPMQHAASMRVSALVLAVFWPGAVGQTCSPAANSPMQGRTGTIKTDRPRSPRWQFQRPLPARVVPEGATMGHGREPRVEGGAGQWRRQLVEQPVACQPPTLSWATLLARKLPAFNIQDNGNGFRPMTQEIRNTVLSWPGGAAVASTWDGELGEQVGLAMAEGHLAKGANVILGPAINLWLFPKGGRNGEYMTGESPLLGHQMAYHFVRGVQGPPDAPTGVIAPST